MKIILFILCVLWGERVKADMNAACGEDVILKCPVKGYDVGYRAVSWYLVSNDHLNGILRWDRKTGSVRKFLNVNRTVGCPSGDGLCMELRNLTAEDRGVYRCSLWAPVGQRNRQGDIQLSITGCSQVLDSFRAEDILLYGALATLFFSALGIYMLLEKNRFLQEENVLTVKI
ncbi:hypothetical protein AAFF_G00291860 [Aldrovandia affinis]|uniref:Ig-like domain-containing protein n=1 Tax=Aldrovandia affinis TaxID=143900 RepID=A0AAD7SQG8_9TELE|nr:hypothetical protein AAFF_G00291860 [Aldrovandia affinis]